jgi:hypothetical protein
MQTCDRPNSVMSVTPCASILPFSNTALEIENGHPRELDPSVFWHSVSDSSHFCVYVLGGMSESEKLRIHATHAYDGLAANARWCAGREPGERQRGG